MILVENMLLIGMKDDLVSAQLSYISGGGYWVHTFQQTENFEASVNAGLR